MATGCQQLGQKKLLLHEESAGKPTQDVWPHGGNVCTSPAECVAQVLNPCAMTRTRTTYEKPCVILLRCLESYGRLC